MTKEEFESMTDEELVKFYTPDQIKLLDHLIKEHGQTFRGIGTNPNYWEYAHQKLHNPNTEKPQIP